MSGLFSTEECGLEARGSVVAPAGCGKTDSIASIVASTGVGRTLVLTHTNAGVKTLAARLDQKRVARARYRLMTLDGWALRMAQAFPATAGDLPNPEDPDVFYPAVRVAVRRLLSSRVLDQPLKRTYARVLVDEYQDCAIAQHSWIVGLASLIPTIVFGDPLQAIFDFRGEILVQWGSDVESVFPPLGRLDRPWRWLKSQCPDLGAWLLSIRDPLGAGGCIDLRHAPLNHVRWQQLQGNGADERVVQQLASNDRRHAKSVMILVDSARPNYRWELARHAPGIHTIENIELADLVDFAREFDQSKGAVPVLLAWAKRLITGVNPDDIAKRCRSIRKGSNTKAASALERAVIHAEDHRDHRHALAVWVALKDDGRRICRDDSFHATTEALRLAASKNGMTLHEAACQVRERLRYRNRALRPRTVGSTLLLKGLEAEHVILVRGERFTARHLYVALTRATRTLTVLSEGPVLPRS